MQPNSVPNLVPGLDSFVPYGNPPRIIFQTHHIPRDFDGDAIMTVFPRNNPPRVIFQTNQQKLDTSCDLSTSCVKISDISSVVDTISQHRGDERVGFDTIMDISRLCRILPPYTVEFYHRILRKWGRIPQTKLRVPKLYELCMLSIGRVVKTSSVIPRKYPRPTLNHIIQRVFRRMLDQYVEARAHEKSSIVGLKKYPGSSECSNKIDMWINRTCYLRRQPCPVERIRDSYRNTGSVFVMLPDTNDRGIYGVQIHQHNYFRCRCPPPPARIPDRLPIPKPKAPKVFKAVRAAQRAERRAKRR